MQKSYIVTARLRHEDAMTLWRYAKRHDITVSKSVACAVRALAAMEERVRVRELPEKREPQSSRDWGSWVTRVRTGKEGTARVHGYLSGTRRSTRPAHSGNVEIDVEAREVAPLLALDLVDHDHAKPVQEGVRVKLPAGATWDGLAGSRFAIGIYSPLGFLPLPHPKHQEGGMVWECDEPAEQPKALDWSGICCRDRRLGRRLRPATALNRRFLRRQPREDRRERLGDVDRRVARLAARRPAPPPPRWPKRLD
jgi:hypothetical protein